MAERESSSGSTSGVINMSATDPPPHKRKLSQPDVNASAEVKKQKLTESDTNTITSKTASGEKDTGKDNGVPKDDLKPPKRATTKKAKPTAPAKPGASGAASAIKPSNASEEFPNGHLYCHQCNKKRDASRESCPSRSTFNLDSLCSHRGYQLYGGCEEVQNKVL